jgi:ribosome recycling factor
MDSEMVGEVLKDADDRMDKAIEALRRELTTIRTGRATPALIDRMPVEYYGTPTPLNQLASISAPEPRLLTVQVWDKSAVAIVEKALRKSEMGLNPATDGNLIRIPIPPLTEERRREMVKTVKHKVEDARVAVRNIRRDALHDLKEMETEKMISEDDDKRAAEKIEELVHKHIREAEHIGDAKEAEVLEV